MTLALKREYVTRFVTFFALKIRPGLHMNKLKQFHKLFRFRKDIRDKQVSAYR